MGIIKEVAPTSQAANDTVLGVSEFERQYFGGGAVYLDEGKQFYGFLGDRKLISTRNVFKALVRPLKTWRSLRAVGDLAERADYAEKRLGPSATTAALDGSGKLGPWRTAGERATLRRYLERVGALKTLKVHRLLYDSPVDARCSRTDPCTRQYLGFGYDAESKYESPTAFVVMGQPRVGRKARLKKLEEEAAKDPEKLKARPPAPLEEARGLVDKLVAPKFDMDLEMKYGADGKPMRMQAIEQIASPFNRHPAVSYTHLTLPTKA